MWKLVNGRRVRLSPEEEAQRRAEEAAPMPAGQPDPLIETVALLVAELPPDRRAPAAAKLAELRARRGLA